MINSCTLKRKVNLKGNSVLIMLSKPNCLKLQPTYLDRTETQTSSMIKVIDQEKTWISLLDKCPIFVTKT